MENWLDNIHANRFPEFKQALDNDDFKLCKEFLEMQYSYPYYIMPLTDKDFQKLVLNLSDSINLILLTKQNCLLKLPKLKILFEMVDIKDCYNLIFKEYKYNIFEDCNYNSLEYIHTFVDINNTDIKNLILKDINYGNYEFNYKNIIKLGYNFIDRNMFLEEICKKIIIYRAIPLIKHLYENGAVLQNKKRKIRKLDSKKIVKYLTEHGIIE